MPLRMPCQPVTFAPGHILFPYWGAAGFHRPRFDVYAVTSSRIEVFSGHADSGSDYTVLSGGVANYFGLRLPFPRRQPVTGAAGVQASGISFAPDGLVSLFATDYREYIYLPRPLVGFHDPGPRAASQRRVLGLTGFLQFFCFTWNPGRVPVIAELDPLPNFPGLTGPLPLNRPLFDFIRELRGI